MVGALPRHAPGRPGEQPAGEILPGVPGIGGTPGRRAGLAAVRRLRPAVRLGVICHTTIMTPAPAARYGILPTSTRRAPR